MVFVTGCTGQDGSIFCSYLIKKGLEVVGGYRRGGPEKLWRLSELGLLDRLDLVDMDVEDPLEVLHVLQRLRPKTVVHFAGRSYVADSFKKPYATYNSNLIGTANVVDAAATVGVQCFFNASTSEIYGSVEPGKLWHEKQMKHPVSPYGISKLAAQLHVAQVAQFSGMQYVNAIYFNHESRFRDQTFLTRKITFNMARHCLGLESGPTYIGSFDARRDWGSAIEFMEISYDLIERGVSGDVNMCTGDVNSVRDVIQFAADGLGMNVRFSGVGIDAKCFNVDTGKVLFSSHSKYFRPNSDYGGTGNSSRLEGLVGYRPKASLKDVIVDMVKADIVRLKKG